jgi:signal transduction histidine kinase
MWVRLSRSACRNDAGVENITIAHELSNELTVIRGNVEFAIVKLASDYPFTRDLQSVLDAADRAIELVRELKSNVAGDQRCPKWWARGRA